MYCCIGCITDTKLMQKMQEIYRHKHNTLSFFKYLSSLGLSRQTYANYKSDTDMFLEWIAKDLAVEKNRLENFNFLALYVNRTSTKKYHDYLQARYKSNATILRKITSLNHLTRYLNNYKLITDLPKISNLKTNKYSSRKELLPYAAMFSIFALAGIFSNNSSPFSYPVIPSANIQQTRLPSSVNAPLATRSVYQFPTTQRDIITLTDDPSFSVVVNSVPEAQEDLIFMINQEQVESSSQTTDQLITGIGSIPAGSTLTVLYHPEISDQSHLLLTPTSPLYGQTLYISKTADGYATVAIEEPIQHNISFNWLTDVSEVYHSIR